MQYSFIMPSDDFACFGSFSGHSDARSVFDVLFDCLEPIQKIDLVSLNAVGLPYIDGGEHEKSQQDQGADNASQKSPLHRPSGVRLIVHARAGPVGLCHPRNSVNRGALCNQWCQTVLVVVE